MNWRSLLIIYIILILCGCSLPRNDNNAPRNDDILTIDCDSLSSMERKFLLQSSRSFLREQCGLAQLETPVLPELKNMESIKRPVHLIIRKSGSIKAQAVVRGDHIIANCRNAVESIIRSGELTCGDIRNDIESYHIQLGILGNEIDISGTSEHDLVQSLSLGIHGLSIHNASGIAAVPGISAVFNSYDHHALLEALFTEAGLEPYSGFPPGIKMYYFTELYFMEDPGSPGCGGLVDLYRGHPVIAAVTPQMLDVCIEESAGWLSRTQERSGRFLYGTDPLTGSTGDENNWIRQFAVAWVLGEACSYTECSKHYHSFCTAMRSFIDRFGARSADGTMTRMVHDPGKTDIASTAFILLGLLHYHDLREDIRAYANALMSVQNSDGSLDPYFSSDTRGKAEFFYPGQALLALIRYYEATGDRRVLETFENAFPYYRRLFFAARDPMLAVWQIQAFARAWELTGIYEYGKFVLDMADWILKRQITDSPEKDRAGGFYLDPDISSASFIEAVLEAYKTAVKMKDKAREQRYRKAALAGIRFILQLRYDDRSMYYINSDNRCAASGAFRKSFTDSTIRSDYVQHALSALLKARKYLFSD